MESAHDNQKYIDSLMADDTQPGPLFRSSALDFLNSQQRPLDPIAYPMNQEPPVLGAPLRASYPSGTTRHISPHPEGAWDSSAVMPLRSHSPPVGLQLVQSMVVESVPFQQYQQHPEVMQPPAMPLQLVQAEPIPMAAEVVMMQPAPQWIEETRQIVEMAKPQMQFVEAQPLPPPLPRQPPASAEQDLEELRQFELNLRRDLRDDAIREQEDIRRQQQIEFTEHLARMQAQLERVISDTMAKIPNEAPVRVVPNEVPVEVTKIVKEEVAKLVETVRYVDRHVEVEVEKVVTKEVPVEVPVPGKAYTVEKPVITEVFVDRVVQHEVPVPYDNVVIREVSIARISLGRIQGQGQEFCL